MKLTTSLLATLALALGVPHVAHADPDDQPMQPDYDSGSPQTASPPTGAPSEIPPAPPEELPPPPSEQENADADAQPQQPVAVDQAQASGQWVYTAQYGWVWMPYGNQYVAAPGGDYDDAYSYVYYPGNGWIWLASPWIGGWGPWPYFGHYGYGHFGWWRRPGFAFHGGYGGYRGHFGNYGRGVGRGGYGRVGGGVRVGGHVGGRPSYAGPHAGFTTGGSRGFARPSYSAGPRSVGTVHSGGSIQRGGGGAVRSGGGGGFHGGGGGGGHGGGGHGGHR